MSESKKYLFLLLLIYCVVRIPIMLSHYDPSVDELDRGAIAVEILEGSRLPFWIYPTQPYGGSGLLVGLYTAPFFALFGKSLFVLKLVPFCLHILSLIAWFFVWRVHFSPKQTFFILLFFVLSPPRITEYTLADRGVHFEMILWMALSILIFRRFLEGKLSEVKAGLSLGLLGGFSSWLILTNLVTVAVLWIYLVGVRLSFGAARLGLPKSRSNAEGIVEYDAPPKVSDTYKKLRFFSVYIPAFLTGFSPWLISNWHYDWEGLGIVANFFQVEPSLFYFSEKLHWVFRQCLRGLFGFRQFPTVPKHIFMEAYTFCYLFSFLYLLWKRGRSLWQPKGTFDVLTFGLLFQILLLSLAVAGGMAVKEYYLFPMVPFIGMTLVMAGTDLGGVWKKWGCRLQTGLAVFCISAGILGNLSLVQFHKFGSTLSLPGYSYLQWFSHAAMNEYIHSVPLYQSLFTRLIANRPMGMKKFFCEAMPEKYLSHAFVEEMDEECRPILYKKLAKAPGINQ